jgi:hypothetical protein
MVYEVGGSEVDPESFAARARHEHRVDACNSVICPRRLEPLEQLMDFRRALARYETETFGDGD